MEAMPEDWERAVAVAAHPDDLEYGMASAVARFTAQGKRVSYVMVTSGEAGIDSLPPEQCGPSPAGRGAPGGSSGWGGARGVPGAPRRLDRVWAQAPFATSPAPSAGSAPRWF